MKKNYSKKPANGFSASSIKKRQEMDRQRHTVHTFAVLGIANVFHEEMQMIEPDCLDFVQSARGAQEEWGTDAFSANCQFIDHLQKGDWLKAHQIAEQNYSTGELHALYEDIQRYLMVVAEESGFDFATPVEMWSARTGRTYEDPNGGVLSAYQAGVEAMDLGMRTKFSALFAAEESFSKFVEDNSPWELVDCGMLMTPDYEVEGGYRDAVFALNGEETAFRVYANPARVELGEGCPAELCVLAGVWEANQTEVSQ